MKDGPQTVLIIDDDPVHRKIYGWIVESAGFQCLCGELRFNAIELPPESADLVLLDYNLGSLITAVEVAKHVRERLPVAPILVLSDAFEMPQDIEPLVDGFVRKGDPGRLIEKLKSLGSGLQLSALPGSPSESPR